jgi:uncharacterized protein GlcG (DUF336 family)
MKNEISADTAEKITQACVDFAKKNNIAVTVFILSPTGQVVHAHRMDGQVPINIETAQLKAQSVLYTRDSSHARANTVANNLSLQMRWANLAVYPVSGGLPIMVEGQMIGAIGVGGSNKDEECAYTALTSVVGPQRRSQVRRRRPRGGEKTRDVSLFRLTAGNREASAFFRLSFVV